MDEANALLLAIVQETEPGGRHYGARVIREDVDRLLENGIQAGAGHAPGARPGSAQPRARGPGGVEHGLAPATKRQDVHQTPLYSALSPQLQRASLSSVRRPPLATSPTARARTGARRRRGGRGVPPQWDATSPAVVGMLWDEMPSMREWERRMQMHQRHARAGPKQRGSEALAELEERARRMVGGKKPVIW